MEHSNGCMWLEIFLCFSIFMCEKKIEISTNIHTTPNQQIPDNYISTLLSTVSDGDLIKTKSVCWVMPGGSVVSSGHLGYLLCIQAQLASFPRLLLFFLIVNLNQSNVLRKLVSKEDISII